MIIKYRRIVAVVLVLSVVFSLTAYSIDDEYYPFVIPWDDTSASSIDAGKLVLDAPAGKHGFVTVKDGHFYFENGERIRFWGTNLCFSGNFPTHDEAEKMAGHMAKFGFNAVRLHHMDSADAPSGIFDGKTKGTLVLDKVQLDRLDYLVYQLKSKGIYVNVNLLVGRKFTANDGVVDADKLPYGGKLVSFFDPKIIELQKDYANKLLNRVNVYTGIKYTEDPAVAMLEIVNENSLFSAWQNGQLDSIENEGIPEYYQKELDKLWNEWLLKKYTNMDNLKKAWDTESNISKTNLLKNGDFSSTYKNGWQDEIHTSSKVNATFKTVNKIFEADIQKIDKEGYQVQLKQMGAKIKKNSLYEISFNAKADKQRSIGIIYMNNKSAWENYGLSNDILINENWNSYKATFISTSDDNINNRFSFCLGQETGKINIGNVKIIELPKKSLDINENLNKLSIRRLPKTILKDYSNTRVKDLSAFYFELESNYYKEMLSYLKDSLRIKVPISSGNGYYGPQDLLAQSTGDFMNSHSYWDHPSFPNTAWDGTDFKINNKSIIKDEFNSRWFFNGLSQNAIQGKPLIISEWNMCFPNEYEYELPMLMTAYAGKQDWDGLFVFAYSHSSNQRGGKTTSWFDIVNNPSKMAQMLPSSIAFINGYYEKNTELTVNISKNTILEDYSFTSTNSRWISLLRLPNTIMDKRSLRLNITQNQTDSSNEILSKISSLQVTSQGIVWNGSNNLGENVYLDNKYIQGFLGFKYTKPMNFSNISLNLNSNASAYLIPLDNKTISNSSRMLLTVVGKQKNTGQINDPTTYNLVKPGTGPTLLQRIAGELTFKEAKGNIKVYSIDSLGNRIHSITNQNNKFTIGEDNTPWYEIVTK